MNFYKNFFVGITLFISSLSFADSVSVICLNDTEDSGVKINLNETTGIVTSFTLIRNQKKYKLSNPIVQEGENDTIEFIAYGTTLNVNAVKLSILNETAPDSDYDLGILEMYLTESNDPIVVNVTCKK